MNTFELKSPSPIFPSSNAEAKTSPHRPMRGLASIRLPLASLFIGLFLTTPVYSYSDTHDHGDHTNHSHADEETSEDKHTGEDDPHGHDEDVVILLAEVMEEFDIRLAQAGPGTLHEEVTLPGEIKFNREHLAYVTPRYDGTVLEIKARLADPVKKGQVLATLESTDTLRPFEVKTPFDGVITAYDITLGETVEAGTPLFTVADLSTVWADLRIYQRDLGKITHGQPVIISGGHEGGEFRGKVAYISPVIDEHTRTGLARVVVDNDKNRWKPGQFIKGRVSVDEHEEAVVVPHTAVLEYEGQTVVFVQTEEGLEPRPIELGHSDAEFFAVESGLEAGETYVLRNPLSLKAELGKGAFGGHQH